MNSSLRHRNLVLFLSGWLGVEGAAAETIFWSGLILYSSTALFERGCGTWYQGCILDWHWEDKKWIVGLFKYSQVDWVHPWRLLHWYITCACGSNEFVCDALEVLYRERSDMAWICACDCWTFWGEWSQLRRYEHVWFILIYWEDDIETDRGLKSLVNAAIRDIGKNIVHEAGPDEWKSLDASGNVRYEWSGDGGNSVTCFPVLNS